MPEEFNTNIAEIVITSEPEKVDEATLRTQIKDLQERLLVMEQKLSEAAICHLGVLIYKSVSDFNVTIGQPGEDNFMGRTAFVKSNFVTVRFAHTKN